MIKSPTKSLSYTIIWLLCVIPSCAQSFDQRHKHCASRFRCGNKTELSYPFWTPGRAECGHPDFEVKCSGELAELSISSVKFRILKMDFDYRIIKLASMDHLNNLCPKNPVNSTFNEDILRFSSDTKLINFYYNCRYPNVDVHSNGNIIQLECKDKSSEKNYVVLSPSFPENRPILDVFRASCNRNINIPVSRSALGITETNRSVRDIKNATDKGFELKFNSDCSRCIDSAGSCGYNQSSRAFVCYCLDEPREHICSPEYKSAPQPARTLAKSRTSHKGIIGIGLASGLLGFILIAGSLYCFIIRRRKKLAAQYTSKDLPIMPYSSDTISYTQTSTTVSGSNHSLVPSISNLANGSVYFGVQVFSYEELEEATENFSKELGDGGFGTVYYGLLKDGREVAVKKLFERSLKRVEQFKNEIEILKSLKHPNLVILYGCTSRHSRELLLVYEYISNGTLAEHLHGNHVPRTLCWPTRLNIAIETASALSFLHASGIIHRDVKTTNILLDSNYQVKVADFGLSRLFPTDQTHISTAPQGTPGYVDPEYYQCYRLNEKSDVYSFGVVLSELISSKEAVDITRHRHDINLANMAVTKIQNNAVHELVDPKLGFARDPNVKRMMMSVAELAFRCLQQEREVRPSMDEILEVLQSIKDSPEEVVDIDGSGGDRIGLLKDDAPPPLSPETDKWMSSSSTTGSSL